MKKMVAILALGLIFLASSLTILVGLMSKDISIISIGAVILMSLPIVRTSLK